MNIFNLFDLEIKRTFIQSNLYSSGEIINNPTDDYFTHVYNNKKFLETYKKIGGYCCNLYLQH